jgi:hypothetical protein
MESFIYFDIKTLALNKIHINDKSRRLIYNSLNENISLA